MVSKLCIVLNASCASILKALCFSEIFVKIVQCFILLLSFSQKKLAEDAADALYQVHGTVFDPINSADLCKLFACFLKYLKQGGSITWLIGITLEPCYL